MRSQREFDRGVMSGGGGVEFADALTRGLIEPIVKGVQAVIEFANSLMGDLVEPSVVFGQPLVELAGALHDGLIDEIAVGA